LTAKESSFGFLGDDVAFGGTVSYSVADSKLMVEVNVVVGNGVTCGFIAMDYIFENKRLRINNIKFEKVNDKMFNYKF
jgi:hypothetical protein